MSVFKSVHHDSSYTHVTGESKFIDDRGRLFDELIVKVVGAKISCGKIKKISTEKALAVEGIVAIYSGIDVPHNLWGTIVKEQPILAYDRISYIDEPILLVVGDDDLKIAKAIKLIEVEYIEEHAILTLDEAFLKKQFIVQSTPFVRGNVDEAIRLAPHVLSGVFECGGQEHFYLESQATIAYPLENDSLEIHSSSQHPTETQHVVAHALGLDYSKVSCIVKRMGGGFGGKESQAAHFAAMAGLVAHKLKRPARLVLTKDEDMAMTGKRHPFKNNFTVAFNSEGLILGLKATLIANGGAYTDLTPSILDRAMFHIDNCYYLENCHIEGHAVRTNQHSNTAFRGFGGPQGAMTIESIIEDIAHFLKKDSFSIRKINLYQKEKRNITPYGQLVSNNLLDEIFSGLYRSSKYENRRIEIEKFNQLKNGKVRGMSLTGCKFGIAFTARHLNQGSALINLHLDGTVQASTGATEMGQGVNTKIRQIIATELGLPVKNVSILSTSTERNHNTSPTAASTGTDINGAAALKGAKEIANRLKWVAQCIFNKIELNALKEIPDFDELKIDLDQYKLCNLKVKNLNTLEEISLLDVINVAYFNRISLASYSFYKTPELGFDKAQLKGRAFNYFTQGAAVSEVELDEYTGELKVLRTDILMDLGKSINPGIDIGQISGAFVQSLGWVSSEHLVYAENGKLLSHSPTTYKIPSIHDIPRIFNIELFPNEENAFNVHRSKAVGEPPFLLGISVWTAIKNAISYRRSRKIELKSPATGERILMELTCE